MTDVLCACGCGGRVMGRRKDRINSFIRGHNQRISSTFAGRTGPDAVRYVHGMDRTPTHYSWISMKQRCLNSNNPRYADYGGRGITVSERWLGRDGFVNFLADMGERPAGTTLDRIDNDGDYEPGNCRWASVKEQNGNKRPYRNRKEVV